MKISYCLVSLVIAVSLSLAPLSAHAHEDGADPETVGAYLVYIESLTVPKNTVGPSGKLKGGEPIRVLVRTTVTADTHSTNIGFFQFEGRVGSPMNKGFAAPIYLHHDCTPAERISVKIEAYLVPAGRKLKHPISISNSSGLVMTVGTSLQDSVDRFNRSLDAEVKSYPKGSALNPFEDSTSDGGGFSADAGTINFVALDVGPGIQGVLIFEYRKKADQPCSMLNGAPSKSTEGIPAKKILNSDKDSDGYADQEEKVCGSKPNSNESIPNYKKKFCDGEKKVVPKNKTGTGSFECPTSGVTIFPFVEIFIPAAARNSVVSSLQDMNTLCPGSTFGDYKVTRTTGNTHNERDSNGVLKDTIRIEFSYAGGSQATAQTVKPSFRVNWE